MSVGKRSELWAHFYPYYLDRSGKYYRCVYCGEIVHSSERRNHLRYHHPEIWEKINKKRGYINGKKTVYTEAMEV